MSRTRRSPHLIILALAGLLVATPACHLGSTDRPTKGPVRLTIGYADPRLYSGEIGGVGQLLSELEDERLVYPDREGRYEAALAEQWKKSVDGLTWTIYLRPGLTFQNGARLDAAAVAADLNELIATPTNHPGLRDILRVEVAAPLQIAIHLRRPSSFVLDALAVETVRTPGKNPSRAGPFHELKRSEGNASLEAFPGYFRGRPAIDQVEVRPYDNARNAWSAMMRDEINVLYEVPPDAMDFIERSSATRLRWHLRSYVYTLGFSLKHPVLRRREVRVALNEAVNREDIVKGPLGGKGEVAMSGLWPRHWAYDRNAPTFRYAPSEAGRLLDAAGLPVKPSGRHRMPSRFRFTCLLPQNDARFERMGLMLQRQLMEVGIDMQLESLPKPTLIQRLRSGDYEAYLTELISQNLEWVYILWHSVDQHSPETIDFGYRGADAALDRLRSAQSDDETRAAVRDLQTAMYEDPPAVFLGWGQIARAISVHFQLPAPSERDILMSLAQWRPLASGEMAAAPSATASPSSSP